jgi:hypothetical protein
LIAVVGVVHATIRLVVRTTLGTVADVAAAAAHLDATLQEKNCREASNQKGAPKSQCLLCHFLNSRKKHSAEPAEADGKAGAKEKENQKVSHAPKLRLKSRSDTLCR